MSTNFKLNQVHYMPKVLEPGILYVSEEFDVAAHLCACGCGSKIRTPLGPIEWSVTETPTGPSLSPSIGNWQKECQSHYWIRGGEVIWARKWNREEIELSRRSEEKRRRLYYENMYNPKTPFRRFWAWVGCLFKK